MKKQMMYAVYTTKASIMPRRLYDRLADARRSTEVWRNSEIMKNYGIIERVMVEKNEETGAFTIYHHEYKKI